MKLVDVFLGSSFKLMYARNVIGDCIRKLNDKWIEQNVRIRLHIWEDFTPGFSGIHKQQEYIDNMVIPSDIAIFLFSHRVGIYTEMELAAKIKQNQQAVHCYRMQNKGKWVPEVIEKLNQLGVNSTKDIKDTTSLCNEVRTIVEKAIFDGAGKTINDIDNIKTLYFYTTIPDDLTDFQKRIGTAFRNLDDTTTDEWGIHCLLHPQKNINLLDATDHYIPILKNEVSDEDFKELSLGIDKTIDVRHRIKRMTVFELDNIRKNQKVSELLDKHGIFPDKIKDIYGLKWKLHEWIRVERKELFNNNLTGYQVKDGMLSFNNIGIIPISILNGPHDLEQISNDIENDYDMLSSHFISGSDESTTILKNRINRNRAKLYFSLSKQMNSWTENFPKKNDSLSVLEEIDTDIFKAFDSESRDELISLIKKRERITHQFVERKILPPHSLLAWQFQMVGIFDVFIKGITRPIEEDELYNRIISTATRYNISHPGIEIIRMNLANHYARNKEFIDAHQLYLTAVDNLEKMFDGSAAMSRIYSIVLTHLFNFESDSGDFPNALKSLIRFQEHIASLDFANSDFFIERCMFITCLIKSINIGDNSKGEIVEMAEKMFFYGLETNAVQPEDQIYSDIMVFLPIVLMAYYIDHSDISADPDEYRLKVLNLAKSVSENCTRLARVDYLSALHLKGELMHNVGFMYSGFPYYAEESIKAYTEALELRRRKFALTGNREDESAIAQTLVNFGAIELLMLKTNVGINLANPVNPLEKANEALEIYGRHRYDNESGELEYLEALQLWATIMDYFYSPDSNSKENYIEFIQAYKQCWDFNAKHPDNPYRYSFIDYSGEALRQYGIITKAEFDEIKAKCNYQDY